MGTEAGQRLESIIRRKELERVAGDGVFVWGIGNSLAGSARELLKTRSSVPVLFSPILSKPKAIDVKPTRLLLWNKYLDENGIIQKLPEHVLVTSHGGSENNNRHKRCYGLFCHNKESILFENEGSIDYNRLCNAFSSKPLGFSQVTAFVRKCNSLSDRPAKPYPVVFSANLFGPLCAQLVDASPLPHEVANEISTASADATPYEWNKYVKRLKVAVRQTSFFLSRPTS
jgi:hypothetical protein